MEGSERVSPPAPMLAGAGAAAGEHRLLPARHSQWTRLRRFMGGPTGAVLGGLLFAAWAAVVNRDGGAYVSLRSSCGQFLASTTLTLVDARVMNGLFARFQSPPVAAAVAAIGSLVMTYGLVVGVHLAIGTPHILLTLLPGIPPTLGFTAVYTLLLLRERAHTGVPFRS
jgi:hypothetical protein